MAPDIRLRNISSFLLPIYTGAIFLPFYCSGIQKCEKYWTDLTDSTEDLVKNIETNTGTITRINSSALSFASGTTIYQGSISR